MNIAIISDIHDHITNLTWCIDDMSKRDVSYIFSLGDYCSPYIVERLANITIPTFAVWGNNDRDKHTMCLATQKNSTFTWFQREFGEVVINNERYFLTHYPELAEHAAKSAKFSAVFHGHTHVVRDETIGTTPVINPGKIAIYPNDLITYCIFDTQSRECTIITKK